MTVVASKEPGNRAPAPPPLALVQAFVNSCDREAGTELFDSSASLASWLRAHGLIGKRERVTARDVRDAIELREAVRQLLLEHNGLPTDKEAHATFARYAQRSPIAAQLSRDGEVALTPVRGGVAGAWSQIMAAIAEASGTGIWSRLKACRSDVCQWAFYDHSKNRSGHWCTMQVCGARAKMRRYRERRGPVRVSAARSR
jgi:predicted RNA-binding Zn ribbon-like protein